MSSNHNGSAIADRDRVEVTRALAKVLAYRGCGNLAAANEWAYTLAAALDAIGIDGHRPSVTR
jgi:hypothetical protein